MSHLTYWKTLKDVLGSSITKVRRSIFESDYDLENFELEADGITEITFGPNGSTFCFTPYTENCSVTIKASNLPDSSNKYWSTDVELLSFWQNRLNIEIVEVLLYFDQDDNVVAIEFMLSNELIVSVQYIIDNGIVFDALTVGSEYQAKEKHTVRRVSEM